MVNTLSGIGCQLNYWIDCDELLYPFNLEFARSSSLTLLTENGTKSNLLQAMETDRYYKGSGKIFMEDKTDYLIFPYSHEHTKIKGLINQALHGSYLQQDFIIELDKGRSL